MADRSFLYAIIGHKNEIRKSIKKTVPMRRDGLMFLFCNNISFFVIEMVF